MQPLYQDSNLAVMAVNCNVEEKNFILASLALEKVTVIPWAKGFSIPSLKKREVIFIDSFDRVALEEFLNWSIQVQLIGRLSYEEKRSASISGLTSFWNLDKYSIESMASGYFKRTDEIYPMHALVWTDNKNFNHKLKSVLRSFSIQEITTNNTDYAFQALKEKYFDLLILDWDTTGIEVIRLLREFRSIKSNLNYFPRVIGIKDFTKMNIFQDLTMGIKDFCPVLFSAPEVMELLVDSLPIGREELNGTSIQMDKPFLKLYKGKNNSQLIFIYPEDKDFKKEKYILSEEEISLHIFKRQFEWLKDLVIHE
jgi:DNA-binding NarL/FixJ family response regulator